jgi:hypothetical protein
VADIEICCRVIIVTLQFGESRQQRKPPLMLQPSVDQGHRFTTNNDLDRRGWFNRPSVGAPLEVRLNEGRFDPIPLDTVIVTVDA